MLRRRPVVISNEIRLKRSQHEGAFLIVEGRDDRLFCERYIHNSCNIVVAENKENVQEVIGILEEARFKGVVGLIDPDFDVLERGPHDSKNIVVLGAHDLEAELLRSPALSRVILEFGSRRKIEPTKRNVLDLLLDSASPIGYLRWLSIREGLRLRFQGLNFARFINLQTLKLDRKSMIREVKNLSQRPDIDEQELEDGCIALEDPNHDRWKICCGDDLLKILSVGLRRAIGTNPTQAVSTDSLRRSLRLAVDEAEFRALSIHPSFQNWEANNPPFRIFR